MNVTVLSKTKIFDNIKDVFEQIQIFVNESLEDEAMYFSHMVINGIDVYDDYEFYIEDHLSEIENIIIEVKSALEFSGDIIASIHQYTERAMPEIKSLSNDFYQGSISDSWEKLNQLLEAVQWVHEAIMTIDREKVKPSNWDNYITIASSFETIFPNMLEALEAKDNILIADIITYEMLPLFQDLGQYKSSEEI